MVRRRVDMSGPSQQYGQQAAQARDLQAVPAGNADLLSNPALAGMIRPEDIPNASDQSTQPDVPVTNGLPTGPGDGPDALGPMGDPDPTRAALRSLVARFPSMELARILADLDRRGQ